MKYIHTFTQVAGKNWDCSDYKTTCVQGLNRYARFENQITDMRRNNGPSRTQFARIIYRGQG